MTLYIDSQFTALVIISGNGAFYIGTDSDAFNIAGNDFLISLLPVCEGDELFLPVTAELTGGKLIGENAFLSAIDWGKDIFELTVSFLKQRTETEPPLLLGNLIYKNRNGRDCSVELYSDNGLRLNVSDARGERGYWLSNGTDGEMRLLDMGGERLLIILSKEEGGETLIAVNDRFEETARLKGDRCGFDDGYFTSITQLDTVLGYEKRVRYEFSAGALKKLPDEVGFFTQSPQMPADAYETALALVQAVRLGLNEEIKKFLSDELYENFTLAELSKFFGEFDECRIAPWQIRGKNRKQGCDCKINDIKGNNGVNVVLGMVKNGSAVRFIFTVTGCIVTDVTEE